MNRRRALAIAGSVVATSATATLAIATNMGLLGFGGTATSLGALAAKQPIELAAQEVAPAPTVPTTDTVPPQVVVQYEDVYVPAAPRAAVDDAAPSQEKRDDDAAPPATTPASAPGPESTTTTAVAPTTTDTTEVRGDAPTNDDSFDHDHAFEPGDEDDD